MLKETKLTFKNGGENYFADCRQGNLRENGHYKQSDTQFYIMIPPKLLLKKFMEKHIRTK